METQDTKPKRVRTSRPKDEPREEILKRAVAFNDGPALSLTDSAAYIKKTYSALPAIIEKHGLKKRRKKLGNEVYILVKELDDLLNGEEIVE